MDDPGEELLETAPNRPSRRTWFALAATVVVAAVIATVLILTRNSDHPPPRAEGTGAPTTSTVTGTPVTVTTVPRPACLDVGDSALNCGVSSRLPASTLFATRTLVPGARVVATTTVTGRDGQVYSRRIVLANGGRELRVRIGPANVPRVGDNVNSTNDGLSVDYATTVGRRRIEVAVRAPAGVTPPSTAALRRLALDPRLLDVR